MPQPRMQTQILNADSKNSKTGAAAALSFKFGQECGSCGTNAGAAPRK